MQKFNAVKAVLGAILAADIAAVDIILGDKGPSLFLNDRLTAWCVIGSTFGALLSLVVFTPGSRDGSDVAIARKYFAKIGASFLCGLAFSPALIEYTKIEQTTAYIVAVSATVSLFMIAILHEIIPPIHQAAPALTAAAICRICKFFGVNPPKDLAERANGGPNPGEVVQVSVRGNEVVKVQPQKESKPPAPEPSTKPASEPKGGQSGLPDSLPQ